MSYHQVGAAKTSVSDQFKVGKRKSSDGDSSGENPVSVFIMRHGGKVAAGAAGLVLLALVFGKKKKPQERAAAA